MSAARTRPPVPPLAVGALGVAIGIVVLYLALGTGGDAGSDAISQAPSKAATPEVREPSRPTSTPAQGESTAEGRDAPPAASATTDTATPARRAAREVLRGHVLSALDRSPIEGVNAVVTVNGEQRSARTDAQGVYALIAGDVVRADLQLLHPDWIDARIPGADLEGEFLLRPAGALEVEIEGLDRGALHVFHERASSPKSWAERRSAIEEGRGRNGGLPPGTYALAVTTVRWGVGYLVAFRSGVDLGPGETRSVALVAGGAFLVLDAPAEMGVQLLPAQQGIPSSVAGPMTQRLPNPAIVAAEGGSERRLGPLLPGAWVLRWERAPGWWSELDLELVDGEDLRIVLQPAPLARVTGRVLDVSGSPVPGARVWWSRSEDMEGPHQHGGVLSTVLLGSGVDSDAAGRFELPGPGGSSMVVAATDRRELPATVGFGWVSWLAAGATHELDLTLQAPNELVGTVTGPEGRELSGVAVHIDGFPEAWVEVGEDGRFRASGLAPTKTTLHASAPGHTSLTTSVTMGQRPEVELDLELAPAGTITGLALDPDGAGIAGIPVRAARRDDRGGSGRSVAWTDVYGRFAFDSLVFGSWELTASSFDWRIRDDRPELVELSGEQVQVQATLRLDPRGRPERAALRGRLVADGGGVPQRVRVDGLQGGSVVLRGGELTATGLVPTRQTITVEAQGHVPERLGPLPLVAGETHDLGLVQLRPRRTVVVLLRDEDGGVVDQARVSLTPAGLQPVPPHAVFLVPTEPGRFVTRRGTRGVFDLAVSGPGLQRATRELVLAEEPQTQLTVQVRRSR